MPNSAYTISLGATIPMGSIIVETVDGYAASTGKNDESFIGVLVEQANFVYVTDGVQEDTNRPIVSAGIVPMRVQNTTGQLVKGDLVAFSKTEPGVGVEAQEQDIVIATIQETVNGDDIQVKPVLIGLNKDIANSQSPNDDSVVAQELSNLLKESGKRIADGDTNPALYLLAIIVVILASVFGFILFGRISINGISAIGRNPLAKHSIIVGIVINTIMVIAFMIGSIFAAAYIIGW